MRNSLRKLNFLPLGGHIKLVVEDERLGLPSEPHGHLLLAGADADTGDAAKPICPTVVALRFFLFARVVCHRVVASHIEQLIVLQEMERIGYGAVDTEDVPKLEDFVGDDSWHAAGAGRSGCYTI